LDGVTAQTDRWARGSFDAQGVDETDRARRGNRRRLGVFGLTFVIACLAGQAWNFSRPAEYAASARVQVSLPEVGRPGMQASSAYATKLQLFDSRPMLARVAEALTGAGLPAAVLGDDPAGRLQSMLQVAPVAGSEIVELRASGTNPRLVADLLNMLPEVVRKDLVARQSSEADAQLVSLRLELNRLERTAAERRARLETFRQRTGVFAEREENEAVAQVKGLRQALNTALEKEAAAAARLKAVEEANERGRSSLQARTDPTLAALETRAHQVREQIKELERGYTPDFIALDPQARVLKSRLVELERQIAEQRVIGRQAALQSAQEDLGTAQAQVARLRAQTVAARPELARTATRLSEAKVYEDDLAQVERTRREVLERVTRLEADEQRRVAKLTVLEAAIVPQAPVRPDYWTDAGWVTAAAALLALAVMGTVEVFNRPPPRVAPPASTTVVLGPAWDPQRGMLSGAAYPPLPAPQGVEAGPMAALAAPLRILEQAEAAALIAASAGATRFACVAGLMGLTPAEALAVEAADVQADPPSLTVRGPWSRTLPAPPWLALTLGVGESPASVVLHDATGRPLTEADVESLLIGVALDAAIDRGATLGWDSLRNTCIDWLVGQGLRYADLPRFVGRVDAGLLQALSARHVEVARRESDRVEVLMPALRLEP
jgi:polysaccharide biosynthesis transport protein